MDINDCELKDWTYQEIKIIDGFVLDVSEEENEVMIFDMTDGLPGILVVPKSKSEIFDNISPGEKWQFKTKVYEKELTSKHKKIAKEMDLQELISEEISLEEIDNLKMFVVEEIQPVIPDLSQTKPPKLKQAPEELDETKGILLYHHPSIVHRLWHGDEQLILKILIVYNKIVLGPIMKRIIEGKVADEAFQKKQYEELKKSGRIQELGGDEFFETYVKWRPYMDEEALLPYLICALENDFFLSIPPGLYESALKSLQAVELEGDFMELVKKRLKHWALSYYIINESIPDFLVEDDQVNNFLELTEVSCTHLNKIVHEWTEEFGGYKLTEKEKVEIKNRLSKMRERLSKVGIKFLEDDKISILLDLVTSPWIVPVSAALDFANYLIKKEKIRKENLGSIVYLNCLRSFQRPGKREIGKCPICGISQAEVDRLSEEEIENILFAGDFCEGHTILYLNIRKFTGAMGRELLRLLKKHEDNKDLRMGAELGGSFLSSSD